MQNKLVQRQRSKHKTYSIVFLAVVQDTTLKTEKMVYMSCYSWNWDSMTGKVELRLNLVCWKLPIKQYTRKPLSLPHGDSWRGSLHGPKLVIPHNHPTRILFPSNFRTTLSLFVFCRPPTNFCDFNTLILLVPDSAQFLLQKFGPDGL